MSLSFLSLYKRESATQRWLTRLRTSLVDFKKGGSDTILITILLFFWFKFLWEAYLHYRQRQMFKSCKDVPKSLDGILNKQNLDKARRYSLDKSNVGTVEQIFSQLVFTTLILVSGYKFVWDIAGNIMKKVGWDLQNGEIVQSLIYASLFGLFGAILKLPFSMYGTFVIEERHGFNKQTLRYFVIDQIAQFLVTQITTLPLTAIILRIIRAGGDYFFIYAWAFVLMVQVLRMIIFPELIIPLFNDYKPLPEGHLRSKIKELAAFINFPLYELLVVEESRKSAHSNAYFFGFLNFKRVVIFDTLLNEDERKKLSPQQDSSMKSIGCNTKEILAILGHEFGHWKYNHVLKNILISKVYSFLMMAFFKRMYRNKLIYAAFGFTKDKPILVGLMVILQFIAAPFHSLLTFFMTQLSRSFEFEADEFAVQLGMAPHLKSALIKITKDNLCFPIFDWLFAAWYHSHPQLLERLAAIDEAEVNV